MYARMQWFYLAGVVSLILIVAGCETPSAPGAPGAKFNRGPAPRSAPGKTALATTEQPVQAETHLAAGRLHESQGRLEPAAEQYRNAAAIAPNCIEAHERLASVLDRLGRFKEAEKSYLQAVQLAPDKAYIQNNFGFSYIMQRRWRDAEKCLTKAIEIKPDFARAHVNLALALAQQEKFDEAFAHFETALPVEDAYFNIGLMYQSKRKFVEAAKAFKTALELNPNMSAARNHLKALPTDALSKADDLRRSETVASPLPQEASPQAAQQRNRPATQPAAELTTSIRIEQNDLAHPIPRGLQDLPYEDSLSAGLDGPWAAEPLLCGDVRLCDWSWLFSKEQ